MATNRRRPGQREIAQAAGVSQSVVSHVLNGSKAISISAATRARVEKAIQELGYIPNKAAQSLRSSKSYTIATIIPDITNPFYPEFVRGIQDVLNQANYDLISYNSDGLKEHEVRGLRAAARSHVDGIIGQLFHTSLEEFRQIVGDTQPAVICSDLDITPELEHLPVDSICIDGVAAGRLVTEYLISRGHKHIAILSGEEMTPPRESRLRGYEEALAAHDLHEPIIFNGDFNEQGGYEAMQQMLALDELPDAVFAANDLIAIGAIRACRERGLRVPDDLAIAGFDDIPAAGLIYPALTTLDQNARLTGQQAAETLLSRLTNDYAGPIRNIRIPVRMVVRDSA